MVRKWSNLFLGLILLLLSILYMIDFSHTSSITIKSSTLYGNSALFVIFAYLALSIGCLLALFRDYHPIKKLGYYPIKPNDIQVNESFRRDFDDYSLTFYSWRDMRFLGKSVDYGYRGLYLSVDYKNDNPVQFQRIIDLFDKVEYQEKAIIFFKENWFIDENDLPRLIKKIHERMGFTNKAIRNRLLASIPERHHLTTKLDFGHHNQHGKIRTFISKAVFFMPQIAMFLFINFFFKTELGLLVGAKNSVFANNSIASLLTFLMGIWHLNWAKYWSLDKEINKETIIHTIKTQQVKIAFGFFFCTWSILSFLF